MSDQFWLTKAQLKCIEFFFPGTRGIPRVDDQRVVSGIVPVIRMVCDGGMRLWSMAPTRRSTTGSMVLHGYLRPNLRQPCGSSFSMIHLPIFMRAARIPFAISSEPLTSTADLSSAEFEYASLMYPVSQVLIGINGKTVSASSGVEIRMIIFARNFEPSRNRFWRTSNTTEFRSLPWINQRQRKLFALS